MSQLKLTEKSIAKLAAPDPSGKQVLHWDTELRGFAILCSGTTNARTYVVQRTISTSGKTRRLTVGAVNELAVAKARDRAADMLDDLRRGIDPKAKTVVPTLKWALDDYIACRNNLAPATVRLYRFCCEQKLADWLDKPLSEIDGDAVELRHRAIAATIDADASRYKGTSTANCVMTVFRILWNHAADRSPDLGQNPCRRLRRQWFDEPRRTRIVRADDMTKFYQAVLALPNPQLKTERNAPSKTRFKLWWRLVGAAIEHAATLHCPDTPIDFQSIFLNQEDTEDEDSLTLADAFNEILKRRPNGFTAQEVADCINSDGSFDGASVDTDFGSMLQSFLYPTMQQHDFKRRRGQSADNL